MAATTSKLPVSVSYGECHAKTHEFLIPAVEAGCASFRGLKTGRLYIYGALSYLGKEITAYDVLEKLVDGGLSTESTSETAGMIEAYLRMLQDYRIGNVLSVEAAGQEPWGFRLRKVAERPSLPGKKLP